MGTTARRAATATLVSGSIVVAALALWKIRVVVALIFLGFIVAAAMRPSVDWLAARARIPRLLGVTLHYAVLLGAIALALWLLVPRAIDQVQAATSGQGIHHEAVHSTGIKHEILTSLDKRLKQLPSGAKLVHPAVEVTRTAFEVLIGIFFVFAVGAYWIFERDDTIRLVQSVVPPRHRQVTCETWLVIDQKLGGFVRGELLLILFVATVLSTGFYLIGLPYWLLIGSFAGIVEIVPVIGPVVAGALAIGVGLTQSWHLALFAGLIVLGLRQLEDYIVVPRVLGHAVGLSPLIVLVSVSSIGILFGGFYVLLAIPIAAVLATLMEVVLRDIDPADLEPPPVIFTGAREEDETA